MSKFLAATAASALLLAVALPGTADATERTVGLQNADQYVFSSQQIRDRAGHPTRIQTRPMAQERVIQRRVVRTAPRAAQRRVVQRRVVRTAPRVVTRRAVAPRVAVHPGFHPGYAHHPGFHPGYGYHPGYHAGFGFNPGWAIAAPIAAAATLPFLPFMALGAAAHAMTAPAMAAPPPPAYAAQPVLQVRN
jgi:hypothetical protein